MSQCSLCPNELHDSPHSVNGKPVCDACHERIQDYANRVQARYERLQKRAERMTEDANATVERARVMGSFIPFGQPIIGPRDRAYRERMINTYARGYAKMERADQMRQRAESAANNRAISSDDPAAILKLQAKLEAAERDQARMKEINAAIRKLIKPFKYESTHGRGLSMEQMNAAHNAQMEARRAYEATYAQHAPKLAQMVGVTEAQALNLLTPDFVGRIGFADYLIKNNNANIRNMKARLEQLKKQAERASEQAEQGTPDSETVGSVRVERDAVENRLRLHFPGKPDSATIADLKARGFRWSPSNMAWQRQLNNGAEWAAKCVLDRYAARQ